MRAISFPPPISYFEERTRLNPETGCWDWQRATDPDGYGQAATSGTRWQAHRLAYAALVGPIPAGMTVDHLCFNTSCTNPAHLALATLSENSRRQRKALSDACPNGHSYEDATTRRRGDGTGRACRTCQNARAREYRARKAVA